MASMVAKACSSTSYQMSATIVQEKGSGNKRKFRADPPLVDPNKIIPLPSNEGTGFQFSAGKFDTPPSHNRTNGCDVCCTNQDSLKLDLGLSCAVETSEVGPSCRREDTKESLDEFNDADWSDLTESQLEELVLSNLDTVIKSAIRKIIASGYSEKVATKAVLRSGLWYGCKDTVSNIVDNTLAFLRSGQEIDPSREHYFENLEQMKKYIAAELVCLLREVRPFFSTGDAMWCLLICDMNVSHACAMDSDPSGSFLAGVSSNVNSSTSVQPQLRLEPRNSESNISVPCKSNASIDRAQNYPFEPQSLQPETPKATDGPNLNPKSSFVLNGLVQQSECQNTTSNVSEKPFSASGISHTAVAGEKFVVSRKVSGITRKEYILRQKSIHFEKHHRTSSSKGTSKSGKLSNFGGLVLDKKLKAVAESTGLNAKNASFKMENNARLDMPLENLSRALSTSTVTSSVPTVGFRTSNCNSSLPHSSFPSSFLLVPASNSPSLPIADTELSLSFPAKSIANPMPISCKVESANSSYIGSSNDISHGPWLQKDRKDDMIMKLVPRVRELQNQLHEWTEWANQRVMQAARRLSKEKAELKALRQEKEEVERLKKEKKTLEENSVNKLCEMENALRKASGQVERANAAVRRLEFENAVSRREMELAKLHAAEAAASLQEVSKREKKTLTKFQSWDKQKTIFQDELAGERRKSMQLQQELQQAKDVREQAEARWNQEEKAKEELLTQARQYKKEREHIEVSTKSKEDTVKSRAENKLQKYKDDILKLEKEISLLRLKTDSSKIAALKRGINGSYTTEVTDLTKTPSFEDPIKPHISRNGSEGVKRERECVMCLSEEMSVVFLPCAHQVVCKMCNKLHKKQGMKDCPSCRGPIQRRICVHYASSEVISRKK